MTGSTEYPPEIDLSTADALISGSLPWIDVPEGYEGISDLISAVRRGVAPQESAWGSPTVAAMALRISTTQVRSPSHRRPARRAGRKVPHLAAALTAVALFGSGAAAAAAGELPAPAQVAASEVASIVGVSIPATKDPDSHPATSTPSKAQTPTRGPADQPTTATSPPAVPNATTSAHAGLNTTVTGGPGDSAITPESIPSDIATTSGTTSGTTSAGASPSPSTTEPASPPQQESSPAPSSHRPPAGSNSGTPGGSNSGSPAGSNSGAHTGPNSGRGSGPATQGGHSLGG